MNAFISYSHSDTAMLDFLHKHLAHLKREGIINTWTDNEIPAGGMLNERISHALENADVFLALLSPDYIASGYCYEKEFKAALKLQEQDKMIIVPVILEPCDWLNTPFKDFKAIPKDGKAVSTWENKNTAFLDVIQNLRKLVTEQANDEDQITRLKPSRVASSKNYRVQKDFDSIQKLEFIEQTFREVTEYIKRYIEEILQIDNIKARVLKDDKSEFQCLLVNRNKINKEMQLNVSIGKEKNSHMPYIVRENDFTYSLGADNQSGSIKSFTLSFDDYHLYWSSTSYSSSSKKELSSKEIADMIWSEWLESVGIF